MLALSFNQTAYAAEYGRIEDSEDPESPCRGCFRRMSQLYSAPCTNVTLAADSVAVEGLSLLHAARFIVEDRREYMLRDYLAAGMIIGVPCLVKGIIHFDRFNALPSEVRADVRAVSEANVDTAFLVAVSFCNTIMNHFIPVLVLALSGRGDIPLPVSAIMSLPFGASSFYKGIKTVESGEGGALVFGGEFSPGLLFSESAKIFLRGWYVLPHACFMALGAHTMLSGIDFEDPKFRTSLSAMVGVLSFGLKVACDSRKPVAGLERLIRGLPGDAYGRACYIADVVLKTTISTLPTALLYTMGAAKMEAIDLFSPSLFEATMAVGLMFSLLTEEGFALLPTTSRKDSKAFQILPVPPSIFSPLTAGRENQNKFHVE
jgi:hypothetical protein